mgnify:CR=1 FL=1
MLEKLRSRARALKDEALAVYLAAQDPRTPWYAKVLILFVMAHTFSPIDLIPDFIPVLGYIDDLIITPLGLALAIRLIPAEALAEARIRAAGQTDAGGLGFVGAALVILAWIVAVTGVIYLVRLFQS